MSLDFGRGRTHDRFGGTVTTRPVYVDRMEEHRDQGFEVAPTRIGGSAGPGRSSRRRRAPLILVILLAIAIPAVAWIGPRIEWRPEVDLSFLRPTPTPLPSSTPRPVLRPSPGLATPLPAITVGIGPHPSEPFPVDVDGLRLADPTTGALGERIGMTGSNDAIFRGDDGGWWCICFTRTGGADEETATAEIRRVDATGRLTARAPVGEYRSVGSPSSPDYSNRFDIELGPGERTAYLASGTRTGDAWAVAVEAIDMATSKVVGRTVLGGVAFPEVPSPSPSPAFASGGIEHYFSGPYMRLSPDGRRLLVWAWVETYSPAGQQAGPVPHAWLIDVGPDAPEGSIGTLAPLNESLAGRLRSCFWTAWTASDEIAATCWPTDPARTTITLSLFTPDGTETGSVAIAGATNGWLAEPVLDRANRLAYFWQPNEHILRRVDLDRQRVDELKVDPAVTVTGPTDPGSGAGGTSTGARPDWALFSSDMRLYYGPHLLAEAGGGRLFALGVLPSEGNSRGFTFASTGIWVFDAAGLALVDRWEAVAAYGSIGLSGDGRWLLAIGSPGSDEDANPANWQASITVHDLSDGRPALQLGSLGTDVPVFQVPP